MGRRPPRDVRDVMNSNQSIISPEETWSALCPFSEVTRRYLHAPSLRHIASGALHAPTPEHSRAGGWGRLAQTPSNRAGG